MKTNAAEKVEMLESMSTLDTLSVVEIEVNSRCNRRCSYCPVSLNPKPPVPIYMSEEVFSRLLSELSAIEFRGRLSYHFFNEPLLRKDLEALVQRARQVLPKAWQVLFTNGELLTDARYQSLREAGIDHFQITSHSGKQHPERENQAVHFSQHLTLTNRGGALTHLPSVTEKIHSSPCWAPSDMMIVSVTGEILLCYEDASRENGLGNIMKESLTEIWNKPAFVELRSALSKGDRAKGPAICQKCTNTAHMTRGASYYPSV